MLRKPSSFFPRVRTAQQRRPRRDRAIVVGMMGLAYGGITNAGAASTTTFLSSLAPRRAWERRPRERDVNPYGIQVVPTTSGKLTKGNTLVSNFNDKANVQGTGRQSLKYRRAEH